MATILQFPDREVDSAATMVRDRIATQLEELASTIRTGKRFIVDEKIFENPESLTVVLAEQGHAYSFTTGRFDSLTAGAVIERLAQEKDFILSHFTEISSHE